VDRVVALLAYEGAGRELVARAKYRNRRAALPWLAAAMAALVAGVDVDLVTWVPTTPDRRRRRGFDQAELLARRVAARLGRPCRGVLRRLPGPAQTGLPLAARRAAPRLVAASGPAWSWRRPVPLAGARVLLVDDVVTSGATATAAAVALRRAGAAGVVVLAAARTPAPARAPPGR
jgi:competence protein ComFC